MSEQAQDRRAGTSAANGSQSNGAPPIDYGEMAALYQRACGRVLCRPEGLYEYNGFHYRAISERDLRNGVSDFLKSGKAVRMVNGKPRPIACNKRNIDNIAEALHGRNGYGFVPPVFLMSHESGRWHVVMDGGILDLKRAALALESGYLLDAERALSSGHTDDFFSLHGLPYEWNVEAESPLWESLVETLFPDPEVRRDFQMLCGYLIVSSNHLQSFWVFLGEPGTGKSTVLFVLRAVLTGSTPGDLCEEAVEGNKENVCCLPLAQWGDRFRVGRLTRALANLVGDCPTTQAGWAGWERFEGQFLDATGGSAGTVTREEKYAADKEMPVTARTVLCMNRLPAFMVANPQWRARLRVIPFSRMIRGTAEDNPKLAEQIVDGELPGVFRWCVKGLGMLLKHEGQFPQSKAGAAQIAEARMRLDAAFSARKYAATHYRREDGAETTTQEAFDDYKSWAESRGFAFLQAGPFKLAVCETFPGVACRISKAKGKRVFRRLAVLPPVPPPPPPPTPPPTPPAEPDGDGKRPAEGET